MKVEGNICLKVQEMYLWNIEARMKEKQQLIKTFEQVSKVVRKCSHLNQLLNMLGEIEGYFTVSFSLLAFEHCYFSFLFYLVSCQMFLSGKTMVMCFNIDELISPGNNSISTFSEYKLWEAFYSIITTMHWILSATL